MWATHLTNLTHLMSRQSIYFIPMVVHFISLNRIRLQMYSMECRKETVPYFSDFFSFAFRAENQIKYNVCLWNMCANI